MQIDELLGVATVAAAAMFVAIAIQPVMSVAPADAPLATAAMEPVAASIVRLPPIEVVARRSVEFARIEREQKFARPLPSKDASRPKA